MELSPHLHSTRDLLMRSLPAHASEQAPPMPEGLAEELFARFEAPPSIVMTTTSEPVPFFSKVRAFFATPVFGLAAAAVVVLGLGVPLLSNNSGKGGPDTFRGADPGVTASQGTAICFLGQNKSLQSAIEKSGSFESTSFRSATTSDAAQALAGPKVIVDFTAGTITAYDAEGKVVHSAKLPDQPSRVSGAVADAVSRL